MTETRDKLRNIALIGHGSAGKTSIAEAMLFKAGVINRVGRVEDGNTAMDFEPEEIKRKSSINTSFYQFVWKKCTVNLIDTPGGQNFFSDTRICMQAADGAIVVIDAIDGVKFQTEQAWEFAEEFNIPCVIFINKLDRERSDFNRSVEDVSNILKPKPIIMQLPIGKETNFSGVVDLLTMKSYIYDADGNVKSGDIPSDMQQIVKTEREAFIENIAEADDKLIERYLEGKELTDDDITTAFKKNIISKSFVPVLCGSATANSSIGIDILMDFIANIMPSPADFGTKICIDKDAPFSGFVVKTVADPYAGRLTIFKILSGDLNADGTFFNATKDIKERYNQLLKLVGKEQKPVDSATAGSIVAVAKLKETTTGDVICVDNAKIKFETAKPLPSLISFAVSAKSKGDEDKIFTSLSKLLEEDMGLALDRNPETKEILLSGCGQVHIEATVEKLKRKFNVEAVLSIPKIPYRETIKKKVRVQGKHKKQSGGHGQYGDCWIQMEPLSRGKGFEFIDAIVGGAIPKTYIPAVEKGILEASQKGVLAGFPCIDFKIILDDGSFHSVDSSEMAFKIAGSLAFRKAIEEAAPVLLEPIMKITITTPDEYMGDIMGDLNGRRGRVLGMNSKGKNQVIMANVPMAEFQTYAPDLRSMTGGRGMFAMEFSHYDEVPPQESKKVIEAINANA